MNFRHAFLVTAFLKSSEHATLRWLERLVLYEVRGTVGARVTWMLIATYFFDNHMYYSYIWVEG